MTDPAETRVLLGAATSRGPSRPRNADAHAQHTFRGTFAAAVVDGTGSTPEVADFARVAADVAARTAARQTPVLGVVVASIPYADFEADHLQPNGAIVVASVRAGGYWRIAHAGDSSAYGLKDDGTLHRFTTPHTLGEELRQQGVPDAEAAAHDHKLRHNVGRVPLYGVEGFEAVARLLVLASDGLKVPHEVFRGLLLDHGHDPQRCAEELLAAARPSVQPHHVRPSRAGGARAEFEQVARALGAAGADVEAAFHGADLGPVLERDAVARHAHALPFAVLLHDGEQARRFFACHFPHQGGEFLLGHVSPFAPPVPAVVIPARRRYRDCPQRLPTSDVECKKRKELLCVRRAALREDRTPWP
ncbi:PP2C family protein-serine/threonine phosphatase [Actinosynnema sp. NPDC059335]|uniref:PP2C family protein-serine/threonine phosphatase n=1 Tax=Actinosynnema sp. NPDC059335 TaxID=3346804 RepID=UPI00366F343A